MKIIGHFTRIDLIQFLTVSEFNSTLSPKLNEKVLKDKRKKLKETFERVIRLYVSIVACSKDTGDV